MGEELGVVQSVMAIAHLKPSGMGMLPVESVASLVLGEEVVRMGLMMLEHWGVAGVVSLAQRPGGQHLLRLI